jgi:hypothetical protein
MLAKERTSEMNRLEIPHNTFEFATVGRKALFLRNE